MNQTTRFPVLCSLELVLLCTVIAAVGFFVQTAHAADVQTTTAIEECIEYRSYQRSIGRVYLSSTPVGAAKMDNYFYIASFWGGLQIADISDPTAPVNLGSYAIDTVNDVELYGDYLLVAAGDGGLVILDLANPIAPQVAATVPTAVSSVSTVTAVGSLALVGLADGTLIVVDITDPTLPSILGDINVGSPIEDIEVDNNVAYIAATFGGVQIVDISDPALPVWLGNIPSSTGIYAIELVGSLAYVNERLNGMYVFDISTPAAPVELGFTAVAGPQFMSGLDVDGQFAYTAGGQHLTTIDISDPTNPLVVAQAYVDGSAQGVIVSENVGYVITAYSSSLNVFDVSNSLVAPVIGAIDLPGGGGNPYIHGDLALVASNNEGFEIVDISDISNPTSLAVMAQTGVTAGVVARGNLAYVTNSTFGLQIVDISTPSTPVIVGTAYIEGTANDVELDGNYAYVTDSWGYFHVVDITYSNSPFVAVSLETPAVEVEIYGDLAYVTADSDGLLAVDISDPLNPVIVDQCVLTEYAGGLDLVQGYAVVTAGYGGVIVVDINSAPSMFEANAFELASSCSSAEYYQGILYVSHPGVNGGLSILDFVDPLAPEFIARRHTSKVSGELFAANGYLTVSGSYLGLEFLPFQCNEASGIEDELPTSTPSLLTLHGNYPNPFNPSTIIRYSVPRTGHGSLTIYNVRGEKVRRLHSGQFAEGPGSIAWNGTTDAGLAAESGVYFYRLEVGADEVADRMVLLK
ncbi:MAG: hypothetical protein ACI9FD_004801 [Gammaproteobacteria bacterium]|jgi:hypothetical protein